MALFKGSKKIAGGNNYTPDSDVSSYSVTFSDSGDISSYSKFEDFFNEFSTGKQISALMGLCKKGFNYLYSVVNTLSSNVKTNSKNIAKNTIKYKDFYFTLAESDWTTSVSGLKYCNKTVSISDLTLGINVMILVWSAQKNLITCNFYNNTYIQFQSDTATKSTVTVRLFYI